MTDLELFRDALVHAPESVSIYELDSTVVWMNPATERMMGTTLAEVRGKRLFDLYTYGLNTPFHDAFMRAADGSLTQEQQYQSARTSRWYACFFRRVGERMYVYARDTTSDVRLFEEAQAARRDAESANRAKDEFVAMLGHELRNPLAPIVTALELMNIRGPDVLQRERAVIGRQVHHLARLVDDLLDVSKITRGKIELHKERLALATIVAKAIEQASPLLEQKNHRLIIDVPYDLVVVGDPVRLAQIIGNLVGNAAKYTPDGGLVEVRAQRSDDHITLTVTDNGIGIAPDMLPHVFDMFVQAPQSSSRPAGGLGLGLTIVKSLVELHGGTVSVTSDGTGKGSTFSFTLPAATEIAALAEAAAPLQIPRTTLPRRILVVDDNEDAAMLLASVLEAHGHEMRTAFDGPSALRIADEFRPQVAVLDIGLPVMDGYELAERLRTAPDLGDVRLIAVSGYGQESDRVRARAAGFQAHLAKPVPIEMLVQLVDETV